MTSGTLRERLIAGLSSDDRQQLLLAISEELALAGRASYVGTGLAPEAARSSFECFNEIQIVILKQLARLSDARRGYPDDAFLDVMAETAARGCSERLSQALERALQALTRTAK